MTRKRYTVQQLATLSDVSVRTLHHYDQIGLLVPAFLGDNGYRYYGAAELLRLQQILLHREFGLPLKDIGRLLDQAGIDRIGQLQAQKARLQAEAARYRLLVDTIDRTIASLTTLGELKMEHSDLYKGFSAEKQAAYEAEAGVLYGMENIAPSVATFNNMSAARQQAMQDALAEIEMNFANLLRQGVAPGDARHAPLVEQHRAWVATMWDRPCPPQAHATLAGMYASHPDFRARYESIAAGLADHLSTAIQAHTAASGAAQG